MLNSIKPQQSGGTATAKISFPFNSFIRVWCVFFLLFHREQLEVAHAARSSVSYLSLNCLLSSPLGCDFFLSSQTLLLLSSFLFFTPKLLSQKVYWLKQLALSTFCCPKYRKNNWEERLFKSGRFDRVVTLKTKVFENFFKIGKFVKKVRD